MTEKITDLKEVLFGLEEYLNFKDEPAEAQFVRDFVKILDSQDREKAILEYCLKNLQIADQSDKIFRSINDYKKKFQQDDIHDAFSRSQVKSKIWLIEELAKIQPGFNQVLILAGWFGQLKSIYDKRLTYRRMRMLELDRAACEISDYLFNISDLIDHKVKSVHADVNNLTLHRNGYEWTVENFKEGGTYVEKFLPDLIINTSAEHMTEQWFFQIKHKNLENNPLVAVQSNNLFDIPEHTNCVHSIDHMIKRYPMQDIIFAGELQLKGYKRVMLIGRP